jgi:hypothetical protein
LKTLLQTEIDRLIGFNQCSIKVEDNATDLLPQIIENLSKAVKIMAGYFLFHTIGVKRIFSKDEVCFLSPTPVGKAISDEKDGIVFFSVAVDERLFASPAEATLFPGVRK